MSTAGTSLSWGEAQNRRGKASAGDSEILATLCGQACKHGPQNVADVAHLETSVCVQGQPASGGFHAAEKLGRGREILFRESENADDC